MKLDHYYLQSHIHPHPWYDHGSCFLHLEGKCRACHSPLRKFPEYETEGKKSLVGNCYYMYHLQHQLISQEDPAHLKYLNLGILCPNYLPSKCKEKKRFEPAWDFQQFGMCDQQSLRPACAYAQPDQSLCLSLEYSMIVKLLTERHLEFLSITGGCRGPSESTLVKMSNCWKSRALAHLY